MNTTWIKIASGVIVVLIIIVIVSMVLPSDENKPIQQPDESNTGPSNFQKQVEQDREKLLVTHEEEEAISNQTPENNIPQPNEPSQIETQPVPTQPQTKEITIYVKQLTDIEQTEAESQINWEVTAFDIGRLPMTSFKTSIDSARRILARWPESIYAYKAKLMLATIPEQRRQQFNITAQELDTSMFLKPRAGTVSWQVTIKEQ